MVRGAAFQTVFLGSVSILSFVGIYSLRNPQRDCLMAARFRIRSGFILKRLSLPIVPIIHGAS